ncbi:hypothetical protein ACLOAV_001971 [Pseudogymnoascus australis]
MLLGTLNKPIGVTGSHAVFDIRLCSSFRFPAESILLVCLRLIKYLRARGLLIEAMVNRGKPSSDCLPCRKRKLRCDLDNKGCSQCQRAKLLCHGYRDPNQLTIRDETYSTKQKALARKTLANPVNPTALQLGWDVRARQAFFSEYIFGFSRSYDVLAALYKRASSLGHLSASVDAVSLAFLSSQSNTVSLRHLANERYVVALQRVGYALRMPDFSATDETLQSVLLLDLYEKMVNRDHQSSMAWTAHVLGAVSLVKSYRNRIMTSYTCRQLATRLVVTLTISCGAARMRVPNTLIALREDLSSHIDNAKWDFTGLVVHVVNLQADLHNCRFTCSSEVAERAKGIDDRFAELERTLPPSWIPRRIFLPGNPLLFGHYYDIYLGHFVTQVRNAIRTVRMMLNDMVLKHSPGDVSVPRYDAAIAISEIAGQICAAIPQFILPGVQPDNQVPFSPLQKLQCYTLIAPLYIAGQLSTDHGLRDWVIHSLEYMAEVGVMKTAKDVADILRATPDMDYWIIYSMLGSYALAA